MWRKNISAAAKMGFFQNQEQQKKFLKNISNLFSSQGEISAIKIFIKLRRSLRTNLWKKNPEKMCEQIEHGSFSQSI